jgi:4-amino-4-deoxy-L-arabinose transferase-like glycosyltransferase
VPAARPLRLPRQFLGLPIPVWAVGGALMLVLLALASAYGFHRDEMYFILAGRHPDFGYVDQPPLTPLLSAAAAQILGASPFAVRVLPALTVALGAVLCADISRRFGASPKGQILAAMLYACSGLMVVGHLAVTATFDIFGWLVLLWLMVGLLASSNPGDEWRRWLAMGLVMGIALENKTLPVFLGISLAGGVVLCRRWDIVRAPAMWAAVALALAIWAPNVIWQAQHDFPQLAMARHIAAGHQGLGDRILELANLAVMSGPVLLPISFAGLVWLLRSPEAKMWRPIAVAMVIDVALMFATAGKGYYAAGLVPVVMAAGATVLDRRASAAGAAARLAENAGARSVAGLSLARLAPTLVGSATVMALIALPLVPAPVLHETPIPGIYAESVAQIGWPELAAQVQTVADSLSPADREKAVILTAAYGQYGGLTMNGRDLPPIYSGHNSVWYWGRPPEGAAPVILVGQWGSPPDVFYGCRVAAVVDNGYDLATEEQGTPIWICAGTTAPWSQIWPELEHIG